MKRLTVSELLSKKEIKPFLYGAFLNRIMTTKDGTCFYAYTYFQSSKAVYKDDFNFISYADELLANLNHFSGFHNWEKDTAEKTHIELRFYAVNDLNISATQFYSLLYQKMAKCEWWTKPDLNDEKKAFIRGFIELRGSVDTTAKLIAQDYFFNNSIELKKAFILTNMMDLPICYANFNPRNLQPQYVSGEKKRNSQFRINLMFYANQIGFINKYKATIFENTYYNRGKKEVDGLFFFDVDLPKPRDDSAKFVKMLNFFTNNIYKKNLTKDAVQNLRKRLGFNNDINEKTHRNNTIIAIFNEITEDKCAICGCKETFVNKNTGRHHFEIHHVISYKNGKELDNIANLVKLCPTCHDMLRKNASSKEQQQKAIIKILSEHPEVLEFAKSYLQIDDINKLTEAIWEMLG